MVNLDIVIPISSHYYNKYSYRVMLISSQILQL